MASGLTSPRLRFVDVAGDVLFPEKKNKAFEIGLTIIIVGPVVND